MLIFCLHVLRNEKVSSTVCANGGSKSIIITINSTAPVLLFNTCMQLVACMKKTFKGKISAKSTDVCFAVSVHNN